MELFPVKTDVVSIGGDLVSMIEEAIDAGDFRPRDGDVVVVAESVVATAEGRVVDLEAVEVGERARDLAAEYEVDPALMQLIVDESDEILGGIPGVVLTVKDELLYPNAGIDRSNAPPGHVTLLPRDPCASANRIREGLQERYDCRLAVIVGDSRTQPMRLGTVGVALACAGMHAVEDVRGTRDLYGNVLRISRLATADNLVSAAQILMREAAEQVPAVLIRGAPIRLDEVVERVPSLPPMGCMYLGALFDGKF